MERITREIDRFKGKIGTWYVLNEMSDYQDPERFKTGAKLTRAIDAVGAERYMRQAFTTARAADPAASLIVNDYNITETYAKQVIARLVDGTGRPLYDVIGIQAHQHAHLWTPEETWKTCERFAQFGKPLHLSEVTLTSGKLGWELLKQDPTFKWKSTREGEKRQAEAVARFYTIAFSHPAVEAITWWDLSDDHAWTGAPAGLLRADMSPKPAYLQLQKLIKGQWWTRTHPSVEEKSLVTLRGFFGDYRVTVMDGKGRVQAGTFTLDRDTTGILEVRLKTVTP
jgi:GH35 family endo-1,4-beta-xylanase